MTLPLDGVTVIALEQAVSAPFATRQLADMGARVLKVERVAEGDFARRYDHGTTRGPTGRHRFGIDQRQPSQGELRLWTYR
jgi:crotonobetainyl-CoA:carnitine CoA-transferase CaiB-like acyl-CoA transferase